MKKLLTFIATLAMLMLPLAQPAAAAWPVNGDCDHLAGGNYFGYVARTGFVTAVDANLYGDPARFQPCTNPLGTEPSGVGQWVSLQSTNITSCHCEIAQIGMWKCGPNDGGACQGHANTLGYFWAYGHRSNCEFYPYEERPTVLWLGAVNLTGVPPSPAYHRFQITFSQVNYAIYFYIDGVRKAVLDPDRVCWIHNSQNAVTWSTERWDPNDGFGGPGPVWFTGMEYAHDWGNYINPYFTVGSSASCTLDPEYRCEVPYNNKVGFYTTQQ